MNIVAKQSCDCVDVCALKNIPADLTEKIRPSLSFRLDGLQLDAIAYNLEPNGPNNVVLRSLDATLDKHIY